MESESVVQLPAMRAVGRVYGAMDGGEGRGGRKSGGEERTEEIWGYRRKRVV